MPLVFACYWLWAMGFGKDMHRWHYACPSEAFEGAVYAYNLPWGSGHGIGTGC